MTPTAFPSSSSPLVPTTPSLLPLHSPLYLPLDSRPTVKPHTPRFQCPLHHDPFVPAYIKTPILLPPPPPPPPPSPPPPPRPSPVFSSAVLVAADNGVDYEAVHLDSRRRKAGRERGKRETQGGWDVMRAGCFQSGCV
ncbi:hypothetical protein E2C01_080321 [Portunus trituberculatus]|uniref:Uncharacterized protein n=1 Tax=Portunus trituberculatus TaxID=210409 RepID=A0A5B7ILW1_PORTR|nr:hypothetical protein [Portunus trituberculatus]